MMTGYRLPWSRQPSAATTRSLATVLLAVAVLAGPTGASGSAPVSGLTLEQALGAAQQRAPLLAGRRAALDAAQAAQISAAQLPDPKLAVGIENLPVSGADRFNLLRDGMTMRRLGWMQEVPNAGKRAARQQVADARAARERALLGNDRLAVRRETALAWYGAYYALQRLALFGDIEQENRVLQATLGARVAAGKAMPADTTMAQLEALQLADRRDELERDAVRARAALAGWVGALDPAAPVALDQPAPVWPVDGERLRGVLHRHAELAVYAPMLEVAAGELNEAQAARRGDWSWEVFYGKRGPGFGDMVSFQVTVDLPLWGERRQEPEVAARRSEIARVQAERDEMQRRHGEELDGQLAELAALERSSDRLQQAGLPLAQQRIALLLAGYEAGRADLTAVLTARRDAAEARLRVVELAAQAQALRVKLATLIAEE